MDLSNSLENLKILVVEDDKDMRDFIRLSLEKEGFKNTWEAEDGKIALSLIKQQNFDLVICDWRMPVMDGLELFKEMGKLGNRQNTDFLMVTSVNDAEGVKTAIKSGIVNYVTKPFEPDTIYQKVLATYEKKQKRLAASDPVWK
ncbi:MAG: response regulator [Gammaproteobacteria bacterium]|nr:response regulator [Gammaproteobacteria bacterium]